MLEKDMASEVAIALLHHAMKTRGFQVVCDYNKPDLTLYHLAASRGLVKFIQATLKEKGQHKIDVNCYNSDGITPLYLAKVFSFQVTKGSMERSYKLNVDTDVRTQGSQLFLHQIRRTLVKGKENLTVLTSLLSSNSS